MFLNADEINAATHWLLENASPPVLYLTHRDILKTDPQSARMAELWCGVETSRAAEELFAAQNGDGTWFSGGPWGPRGYRQQTGSGYTLTRPKFVTTAWILPYLGEMGFTAADARVRKSCELILRDIGCREEAALPTAKPVINTCGLSAIPLRALASVGMAGDECLKGHWDWLARAQRNDGGWLNPNHLADSPTPSKTQGRWPWERSCAWGSYFAVQALYYAANPEYLQSLSSSLGFLLGHLSQKDTQHVQTWVYHGHNIVKELLMCSEAGFDMDAQPIRSILEWLRGYYRPDEGVFRTQQKPIPDFARHINAIVKEFEERLGAGYWSTISKTSPAVLRYHLYHLVEDDWLTYTLVRVARNMQSSGR